MGRYRVGRPGVGAMLMDIFGGHAQESHEAWQAAVNKTIDSLELDPEANGGDGGLIFTMEDGTKMMLCDRARSCCERRYLHTDDDLDYHVGAELRDVEVRHLGGEDDGWGVKETSFLYVTTSEGRITVNCYNEHNGYYGGIRVCARLLDTRDADRR